MSAFVINGNNHFFEVQSKMPVDLCHLKENGCEICPNKAVMYESVVATTGQDLNEIEGGELVIREDIHGHAICTDARGVVDHIEGSAEYQRGGLEEYIIDWAM